MCYLRKSWLKQILTLFIHWNFNFIGKMVLRVVTMLTNWLVHPTWNYTTFWIRISCYCNTFFSFVFFSLETIHLGSLHGHLLVWGIVLVYDYNEVVSWVCLYIQSQWEILQLLRERGSARGHPDILNPKSYFPEVLGHFPVNHQEDLFNFGLFIYCMLYVESICWAWFF